MEKIVSTKKSRSVRELLADERGLTTVEYVIILALIAIVGIAAWRNFGNAIQNRVGQQMNSINSLPQGS